MPQTVNFIQSTVKVKVNTVIQRFKSNQGFALKIAKCGYILLGKLGYKFSGAWQAGGSKHLADPSTVLVWI